MEEELLNLIGKFLVEKIKERILTPTARYTKTGAPKTPPRYNFSSNERSGTLYNSVEYVIRDGEIDILMVDYGVDFVFGGGSKPKKPLPVATTKGQLTEWVVKKLHIAKPKATGIAFAISKNLSKVGYKGYNLFTDDFQNDTAEYIEGLLEQPQYQELVLGDIFDRINIFGTQQYNIALG